MISTSQDDREAHAFDDAARASVYRAIGERRDVRCGFLSAPLPPELITRLLTAAHNAPSIGFMQPSRFIVVSILSPQALRSILNTPAHIIPITYLCLGHVEAFAGKPELEQHGWERRLPLANVVSYEIYGAGEKP